MSFENDQYTVIKVDQGLKHEVEDVKSQLAQKAKYEVDITKPPNGITPAALDGITDISTTLQACIDFVNANGVGSVYIPYNANGYTISKKVVLKSNVSIVSNDSIIKVPSVSTSKFWTFHITNCSNVRFYGKLNIKSTIDKPRIGVSGTGSNVLGITIDSSKDVYIESVYGENLDMVVNVFGTNTENEKNVIIDELQYLDCYIPFFVKQYSQVKTNYIHGTIKNIVLDPLDHVVYVSNNCYDIYFGVIQGKNLNVNNAVWMVQFDTNLYTEDKLSKNITVDSIIVEGSFGGFVCGGTHNVYIGQIKANTTAPSGILIGAYGNSKTVINNVTFEGSIGNFISCLGASNQKNELTVNSGKINGVIGGAASNYLIRGEYIKKLQVKNVIFDNVASTGTSIFILSAKENESILLENCQITYSQTLTGIPIGINSGNLEIKGCKFINSGTLYDQVISNSADTTVNVFNSIIKNFKTFLYWNPPVGSVGRVTNCTLVDDNSIINELNGYVLKTFYGTGSPEGVITAKIGSVYHRADGGAGTTHYFKESGTGNTGWVAK